MPKLSQIIIEQQLAEIGINRIPAQMHIEQQRLEMRIETEQPKMEIDRKAPTFKVNRKKINSEMGLKGPTELSRNFRDQGRLGALRGARIAKEDGNFLGDLTNPGDRVGQLARNKTMSAIMRKKEGNIGLMPKSIPEIEWEKGYLNISWTKHSIVIDWVGDYMPTVTLDPKHSIEVYLRTAPYFRILVSEGDSFGLPGSLVDKEI
ncbi:MAG: DUF6470 family protein [Oscillospiraceae bacterium]|nr:DUF6470 family protein [Oscillospiraceae bacterium]